MDGWSDGERRVEAEKRRQQQKKGGKDPQSLGWTLFPSTIKYLPGRIRNHMEMISLSLAFSLTSAGVLDVH